MNINMKTKCALLPSSELRCIIIKTGSINKSKLISKCYGFNNVNRECQMAVCKKEHLPLHSLS
jgi:hypothetical protein